METRSHRAFLQSERPSRKSNGISRNSRGLESSFRNEDRNYASFNQSIPVQTVETEDDDAVQPLRTMANRVGKEVERFAEKLDQWMSHGRTRGKQPKTPAHLVEKLREEAQFVLKPLQSQHGNDAGRRQAAHARAELSRLRYGLFDESTAQDDASKNQGTQETHQMERWESEVDTWDLANLLFNERHAGDKQSDLGLSLHSGGGKDELWAEFLLNDDAVKEKHMILSWLKQTANTRGQTLEALAEQFESLGSGSSQAAGTWTQGWQATKEKIKGEKLLGFWGPASEGEQPRLQNSTKNDLLITQLDPDAPLRQSHALEDPDELQERFIWYMIFQCQRRGLSPKEMREWLSDRNESWRGVSLGLTQSTRSAQAELLWRRTCFANSNVAMRPYEAATYGVLGGDLLSVTRVTASWEDHMFAHFNSLVISRYVKYLQGKLAQSAAARRLPTFAIAQLYDAGGDFGTAGSYIVDSVSKAVKQTAFQKIQGSLIARDFTTLLVNVGKAVAQLASSGDQQSLLIPASALPVQEGFEQFAEDEHIMRILVHLYIAFKAANLLSFGSAGERDLAENVIVWYIDMLRVARKLDLLPVYAAQLSADRLANTLGHILPGMKDEDNQRRTIRLMQRCGIDVDDVLSAQFTIALKNCGLDTDLEGPIAPLAVLRDSRARQWPRRAIRSQFVGDEIEPAEQAVIDALQWFLHLKAWRFTIDAVAEATIRFLRTGRLAAAVQLTKALPIAQISLEKTPHYLGGERLNIAEWSEDSPDNFAPKPAGPRSNSKKGHSRQNSMQSEPYDTTTTLKRTLKKQAKTCIEVQQLVTVLNELNEWAELLELREAEQKDIKALFNKIHEQMGELLVPGFLEYDVEVDEVLRDPLGDEGSDLQTDFLSAKATALGARMSLLDALRPAYIPEVILAYIATIYSAAQISKDGRDKLLYGMEMAALIADDEHTDLANLFVKTKRMTELVDILAQVSLGMVEANEAEKKQHEREEQEGKKSGRPVAVKRRQDKREWEGEVLSIWDLTVKN